MTTRAEKVMLGEIRRVGGLYELHRKLDERAFYPKHDLRKESPEYARVHHAMVHDEDLPCEICGVRNSTLRRRTKNPFRASQLETHHATIEWALANIVSLELFQRHVIDPLAVLHPEKYRRHFTKTEMRAWIDHDRDNLMVLCDVHHRHKWVGVHAITGPVWIAQRVLEPRVASRITRLLG